MNISAPASVPDLASLALLLAAPPDAAAALPGFAPPPSLPSGAGAFHSFESTLSDLLSVEGKPGEKPEDDPKQQESKTVITGVVIPAPAPETLPFQFAMPFQPALKVEAETGHVPARAEQMSGASHAAHRMPNKAASSLWSIPASSQPEDTATPFAFTLPASNPSEPQTPLVLTLPAESTPAPQARPRGAGEPVPAIVEPGAATLPELTPAPELPNLAFTEKFTPAPALLQDGAALPAAHALPQAPPKEAMLPIGDRPTESAKKPVDGVPQPPAVPSVEPDHAAGERRGNGERQHSAGESSPQPKADPAPAAREAARVENPRFEPLAPVAISSRQPPPAEASQSAPVVKSGDTPNVEPDRLQAAPPSHAPDTHAISVRVTDAGDTRVELKVTEHAGELKVAVRTADPALAGSLRENLGDLVHKLEQSGFRADTWHPAQSTASESNPQTRRAEGESLGGDHSGRQEQHAGDGRQRKQQDHDRAGWVEELETSLAPDSERKGPIWLQASVH